MAVLRICRAVLLVTSSVVSQPLLAQTTDPSAPAQPASPSTSAAKRVYTPADFARFAPKTAYDMLRQVPGFTIRSADDAEVERGLGQAKENVLINGQRIANKSGGAVAELQKIGIGNVERVEIVEAASLGIAGLSGQVANVIVAASKGAAGQFEWKPDFRAHYADPRRYSGVVSYSAATGPLTYTLSVENDPGRGAFGGPVLLYDPDGLLIEDRHDVYHSESEDPELSAKLGLDGPGSSVANLILSYTPYWYPESRRDRRTRLDGNDSERVTETELDGWLYDVSGDFEFALGPGRLKLIGLRHFDHEPLVTTQVQTFTSGVTTGTRLSRDTRIGETVGRAEYRWKGGVNDWQLSLERAFNSLDQRGKLFELSPEGEFEEVSFPEGTGKVTEVRYEGIATLSRPLAANLDLQLAAGGEISHLDRVDDDLEARKFFRPKGSLTLGWRPAEGWDASLKLTRKVGQISFYDFLAQPKLSEDRENAGNPDLVPPQSWELETEVGRDLGVWGKTRLKTWYHRVQDIVDIVPIGEDGQGIGNLPRASRLGFESVTTLQLDPVGWSGAKVDLTFGAVKTRVRDPLTGERRPISGTRMRWFDAQLRHDVQGTDFAWGASAFHDFYERNFYLTEVFRSWEGPWWIGAFVEHKDVMGMTVRADVGNLLNARHRLTRYVYEGRRDVAPLDFVQRSDQLIGPIFSFSVKGTF